MSSRSIPGFLLAAGLYSSPVGPLVLPFHLGSALVYQQSGLISAESGPATTGQPTPSFLGTSSAMGLPAIDDTLGAVFIGTVLGCM